MPMSFLKSRRGHHRLGVAMRLAGRPRRYADGKPGHVQLPPGGEWRAEVGPAWWLLWTLHHRDVADKHTIPLEVAGVGRREPRHGRQGVTD